MANLVIDTGSMAGCRFELHRDCLVVGRQEGCDVVLKDDTVSRQHARIVRNTEGYFVEDLNSRNGTFLNGKRIEGRSRLRSGDRVQLYDIVMTFHDGGSWRTGSFSGRVHLSSEFNESADNAVRRATVAEIDVALLEQSIPSNLADVRLQAVLDVARRVRNWLELDDLYSQILDSLFQVFPQLDRACILRLDEAPNQLVLDAVKVRGCDAPGTIGPIMQAIVKQSFNDGKALLNVDVVSEGAAGSGSRSIHEVDHRCVMCAPMIDSTRRPQGAIYLDTGDVTRSFSSEDLDVLACVAVLASQAVEQATLHNARYRAVVDTSADAIITFDEDGTVDSSNPAACELFAYDHGDLRGMSICRLVPDLAPLVSESDAEVAEVVRWMFRRQGEATAVRADGSRCPVWISIGELRLAGRKLYTASLHDITEQKRVENTLKTLNDRLEREVRRRTGYVQLHQEVAVIANEADTVLQAFQAALDEIRQFTRWPAGHVFIQSEENPREFVDSGIWSIAEPEAYGELIAATRSIRVAGGPCLVGRVISTGAAHRGMDLGDAACGERTAAFSSAGVAAVFAFPVLVGEDVVAVAEFFAPEGLEPDNTLVAVMMHVGTQLGRVVERRRLQQEVVDAVWEQQRAFGQDLHDTVGQELTGIAMLADSLARKLAQRTAPEAAAVRELAQMLQQAKQNTRRLAKGLLPVEVDAEGLKAALEELAENTRERCGIEVRVQVEPSLKLEDNRIATHLFRIAQEAVTNVVRHASAHHLMLGLSRTRGGAVELRVSDDGRGMPRSARRRPRGVGLQIMRYRAQLIDADLAIQSGSPGGTEVVCRLPRSSSHVC